MKEIFPPRSIFLAPMEGITNPLYRSAIEELYSEWDFMSCDFLRVPCAGFYRPEHLIKHYGAEIYESDRFRAKTIYQILTTPIAQTQEVVQNLNQLKFPWLDLNLGCPSRTVCKRQGGSYLLSDLENLENVIKTIRRNFDGIFTCKIRVGYADDENFEDILRLLETQGVEAITVHARTRAQMYKGTANWEYIKNAANICSIPIIGNGDLWTASDIDQMFQKTGCHSVMVARGALKTPWLAKLFKLKTGARLNEEEQLNLRRFEIPRYLLKIHQLIQKTGMVESVQLRKLKSLSYYLFDDFPEALEKRRLILRSSNTERYINNLRLVLQAQS